MIVSMVDETIRLWTDYPSLSYSELMVLAVQTVGDEYNWWFPNHAMDKWKSLFLNHPDKWEDLRQMELKLGSPIRLDKSMDEMEGEFINEIEGDKQ